jgi:hypothetical protein
LPGNSPITIISLATNRVTIQDGVRYSVGHEGIKGKLQTVQFTPPHDMESMILKTEVKICLPGRAVQNAEIEDTASSLFAVKLITVARPKKGQINKVSNKQSTNY